MRRHVQLAVAAAVVVTATACGGTDDRSDESSVVLDAEQSEPFAFVDTGWYDEGAGRPRAIRTEMLLLSENCDLSVAVPGGVQHGVVSASGDSFVRSRFADGSWASDAAWRDDVVIAAIEPGEWHAAPTAPFRAALAAQELPDLDAVVPRSVTTIPFHRSIDFDVALTVDVDTDALAAHQAAAADIVETLIGVSAAPLRPGATMSWTRWWSDGTLVAEERRTPIAGACIFQASAFAPVAPIASDAIGAAELIFDIALHPMLADAARIVGPPVTDGAHGFGGTHVPQQVIPLPSPVGSTSHAGTSLNAAASGAGTTAQTYGSARAIGLRTALGYVSAIAHAVSLIDSLKTLGEALADAITGESSSADLVLNASDVGDHSAGTSEGPVTGTTTGNGLVEGTPKSSVHQDDRAENADAVTQADDGRRRVIQQPELTHPDLLDEAQGREGLDAGRKPDRLVENDDGEFEVWDTKHSNGDTATPSSAADAAHDSLAKGQSRRVTLNLDGTKNDPAEFADELRDYVDDYNVNVPLGQDPYWDGMKEVVVTKNGETYPVWP